MNLKALVLSLPTRNSTMRMRVWRGLKETGCAVLRDGVYVLPAASAGAATLAGIESEIRSAGGFAMTGELKLGAAAHLDHVRKLFDRGVDYGALVQAIATARSSMPRLGARKSQTTVDRLQRRFDRLAEIDFFPGQAKSQAAEALSVLKRRMQETYSHGEPQAARKRLRRLDRGKYQKRVWATREGPWVDRLASAWLIKRFVDRDARFVWIERPRDRPKGALGFDFDGAEFTHADHRVTFEVLSTSFSLDGDAALGSIGAAVHFLDVGGIPVPDARGLETMLTGVKAKARNDDELLHESMKIFDLLYSAYGHNKGAAMR